MKKIEEEIKQDNFRSDFQKAVLNISITANVIHANTSRFLKHFNLSPEQFNVLRILRGQKGKPANILLIQERMMDKMSNASRLVDKLENKKLVNRKQCPEDRRQVEVTITKKGLELLQSIDGNLDHLELTPSSLKKIDFYLFNEALDQIREHFRQEIKK